MEKTTIYQTLEDRDNDEEVQEHGPYWCDLYEADGKKKKEPSIRKRATSSANRNMTAIHLTYSIWWEMSPTPVSLWIVWHSSRATAKVRSEPSLKSLHI